MATETVLNKLTINSVESREVYQKLQEKGLINKDELYIMDAGNAFAYVDTSIQEAIQAAIQDTWEANY